MFDSQSCRAVAHPKVIVYQFDHSMINFCTQCSARITHGFCAFVEPGVRETDTTTTSTNPPSCAGSRSTTNHPGGGIKNALIFLICKRYKPITRSKVIASMAKATKLTLMSLLIPWLVGPVEFVVCGAWEPEGDLVGMTAETTTVDGPATSEADALMVPTAAT